MCNTQAIKRLKMFCTVYIVSLKDCKFYCISEKWTVENVCSLHYIYSVHIMSLENWKCLCMPCMKSHWKVHGWKKVAVHIMS